MRFVSFGVAIVLLGFLTEQRMYDENAIDPMTVRSGTEDGRDWVGGEIVTAGGCQLHIVAVADGDEASTVLLTGCS